MATDPTFSTSADRRRLEAKVAFNADAPLTLSASNASGRVDVTTDATLPAGTLEVAAIRTDDGEFEEGDHHLTVKVEGNSVSIHPDWQFASGVSGLARRIRDQLQYGFRPEDWNLSRLRLSPELDFHILVRLPASLADGSQIKLRTASGEVDARNFQAGASIITASGDVDAHDLTGTVSIHTASGDVEAENIIGSLEVNTASGDVTISGGDAWLAARSASGDVEIRDVALRNARVTTVSGDVDIRSILNNAANYGIETVSGDVTLDTVLPNAVAKLSFGTLSGSSDVGPVWEKRKRREWTAGAGDTGATINVKTVSGDLSASARLDDTIEAREIPMPTRHTEPEAESEDLVDFKEEMKQFGREMKHFGEEMKHLVGAGAIPPVPPTPPTPPTPPHGAHDDRDQRRAERQAEREQRREERTQRREERHQEREQRREERQQSRDEKQRLRDIEQQHRDREQQRRDLEQQDRDRDQDREAAATDSASPLFTAGPAGVDYQRDTAPISDDTTAAQPTEPVAPAQPYTEEPQVNQQDTAPQPEPTGTEPTQQPTDARLRVLEALEKGEIDIEDALAQLDRESGGA